MPLIAARGNLIYVITGNGADEVEAAVRSWPLASESMALEFARQERSDRTL